MPDHLGTPRAITRPADNAVVWKWDNTDPFGANLPSENPSGLGAFSYNLRFPGQYYDVETGTRYNARRDYDPALGRYIQSDPIGLNGGINTYAYVNGNPLNLVDPFGLAGCKWVGPVLVCEWGPAPVPTPGDPGVAQPGWSIPDFELRDWWYLLFNDRSIPKPKKPACGCTCICRADANDNIPGNIKPGEKAFAFGEATEDSCAKATKEAKRIATRNLGKQPKHLPCRCSN
jgi:RHS repeat-associated protein